MAVESTKATETAAKATYRARADRGRPALPDLTGIRDI
jgi:hypothetical protein